MPDVDLEDYIQEAREADQLGWDDDNHFAACRFALVEQSRYDQTYYVNVFDNQEDAASYHDNQEYPEDWPIVALIDKETGKRFYPVSHTTFEEVPD